MYEIFLFTNRSGQTLHDFNFTVDFSQGDTIFLKDFIVEYREDDFNTLPDKSVIAILLPIDNDQADILKNGDGERSMAMSDLQPAE